MVTVGLFPGTKRPVCEADHSPSYRTDGISGAIPSLPHVPSWRRRGNILPLLYYFFIHDLFNEVRNSDCCVEGRRDGWVVDQKGDVRKRAYSRLVAYVDITVDGPRKATNSV